MKNFINPYKLNGYAYKNMPKEALDLNSEDLPLYMSLLSKISWIEDDTIGKKYTEDGIIKEKFRLYKYCFNESREEYLVLHLIIFYKENFFNSCPEYIQDDFLQNIPLTYETMSKMTDKELSIIFTDFD